MGIPRFYAVLAVCAIVTMHWFTGRYTFRTFQNLRTSFSGLLSTEMLSELSCSQASFKNVCPTTISKRPPLDPFSDLIFTFPNLSTPSAQSERYFSSYHCVGTGSAFDQADKSQTENGSWVRRRPNYVNRQCHYRNLYYKISDQSFHYFPSPSESALWKEAKGLDQDGSKEAYEEMMGRMEVTLGLIPDQFSTDQITKFSGTPWKPVIHDGSEIIRENDPPAGIIFAQVQTRNSNRIVFALYQPFHGMNFGHLLWDDCLGMFSLLDRFDLAQDETLRMIPFYVELRNKKNKENFGGSDPQWRCSPWNHQKWQKCVKMYSRVFPDLLGIQPDQCSGDIMRTGNWLRGEDNIGVWKDHPKKSNCLQRNITSTSLRNEPPDGVDYILMPQVLTGTGRTGFYGCDQDCALGRSQEYYRFRRYLIQNIMGASESCRLHALRPRGLITFSLSVNSSRPGEVCHFEQEINLALKKYGDDVVQVVDMSKIPMDEQAKLVADSAVLITNHGGVGAASIFLPRGAAVIVFWHGDRRKDHHWYESAGYFRCVWVGVDERRWINRTMGIIDDQFQKAFVEWESKTWALSQSSCNE